MEETTGTNRVGRSGQKVIGPMPLDLYAQHPALFYHTVTAEHAKEKMDFVRAQVQQLAQVVLACCPVGWNRSVAMAKLEQVSMNAIASIAVAYGEPQTPRP